MGIIYLIIGCILINNVNVSESAWAFVGNPLVHAYPCKGNKNITISTEAGLPPDEENQYYMYISIRLPSHSKVYIKFDHPATVTLTEKGYARIYSQNNNVVLIHYYKEKSSTGLKVKGATRGVFSYPTGININTEENCENPDVGIFDGILEGEKNEAEILPFSHDAPTCGRRKVLHTELITNGLDTKPGDWPWHAALYRIDKVTLEYKCGGTLISKDTVLTAAHCTTIRGAIIAAERMNIVLGKYNLFGGDTGIQEKQVLRVIVHDQYNPTSLDHDISLLKLSTEVMFTDYVQPACLWSSGVKEKLDSDRIYGTVVGWGFEHTDQLAPQLRQATMPKVSDAKCLKSDPVFFGKLLNEYKFCAGLKNGTSACNGDSGGGFTVFVPDERNTQIDSTTPGSWFIRGLVSVGVSRRDQALCDPYKYALFTDIAKYTSWIENKMK